MKALYLVRHAKSSWDHPGVIDLERPLMEQGIRKSKRVIQYLKGKELMPGLILTSPAKRAVETAKLFALGLGYPAEKIQEARPLYDGSVDEFLNFIYSLPDHLTSLMVFGHNPTITQIAELLLSPDFEEDMSPAAVIGILFDTHTWHGIREAESRLLFYITPKSLK